MGRAKSFDTNQTLGLCATTFIAHGYEGTSIDQLVASTGLLRGSLYGAFGSKRGLFVATLSYVLEDESISDLKLDLSLIALLELASDDDEVKSIVKAYFERSGKKDWPQLLGKRLLSKVDINRSDKEKL